VQENVGGLRGAKNVGFARPKVSSGFSRSFSIGSSRFFKPFPLPASQLNQDQTLSSTVPSDFDVKPSGLTIRPMSSLPSHKKPPLSQSPLLPVLFELKTGDSSAPLLR